MAHRGGAAGSRCGPAIGAISDVKLVANTAGAIPPLHGPDQGAQNGWSGARYRSDHAAHLSEVNLADAAQILIATARNAVDDCDSHGRSSRCGRARLAAA